MFWNNGIWYYGWVDVVDRNCDSFGRIVDFWGGFYFYGCFGLVIVVGCYFDLEISYREVKWWCKLSLFIVWIFFVVVLLVMLYFICMICGENDIMLMI